jgi:hypothetical protein
MMKTGKLLGILATLLSISILAYGQGNTFTRIRYQGGSVPSTVKSDDWKNTLIVTSDEITLKLKDGNVAKIDPKRVTGLSYGQEAHRRVGTMIALAVLVAPLALFGLFHKTRKHYIGIEWQEEGDKRGGVLLQADKDDYRGVLMALRGVTGAPVAVAEEERKYVPTGIETVTPKEKDTNKEKDKTKN